MLEHDHQKYYTIVDQLRGQRIAVVGDLILDRYIWGAVDRISPEAPVPVVEELSREQRLGGAANVVSNLRGLAVNVDVFGVRGADEAGEQLCELLEDLGAACFGVVVDTHRPTTVKTRILGGSQQMLRLDQEWRLPISGDLVSQMLERFQSDCASYNALVISDYGKGVISRRLLEGMEELKSDQTCVVIDPNPANYDAYCSADLIKPNKKEAEVAARMPIRDVDSAFVAAQKLLELWGCKAVLITLGSMGMVLLDKSGSLKVHLEAQAKQVFDVSGAGDCVTAIFSACLGKQVDWVQAGELANIAAGVVISEVGTAPIGRQRLLEELGNR